jgi:hypothetical protein
VRNIVNLTGVHKQDIMGHEVGIHEGQMDSLASFHARLYQGPFTAAMRKVVS